MPDWQKLVLERLSGCWLTSAQQNEIVVELAAHLEDRFELERASGLDESEAIRRTLDEVDNWRVLARRIHQARRQEDLVNHRTKSIWVPGLVCSLAAMGSRMLLVMAGIEPRVLYAGSKVASAGLEIYLPWLVMLPVIGALAAYLSRRADGRRPARLVAALFPSLVFVGLFLFGLTVTIFSHHPTPPRQLFFAFGVAILNWIVIPGAALFLGAVPFIRPVRLGEARLAGQ
ncbi:MAG TPA: hypothetical protein VKR82_08710 [Candidatus Acidoferrales bacterium]|nr:hypothetical protein [Candidatus Acidoferrales bacterium]